MKKLEMSRKRSGDCAGLVMMMLLTACLAGCRSVPIYGQAQQPRYLLLQAGQTYRPAQPEKWVNPAVLEEKDAAILELSNALERQGIKPFLPK